MGSRPYLPTNPRSGNLGPVPPCIADYPEQVWLTGVVPNWCPKCVIPIQVLPILMNDAAFRCDAKPSDLDNPSSHRHSHEKTDFLISTFDPGILWDEFGIRSDVVVCIKLVLVLF